MTAHEHAMALWRSDSSPSPAAIEGVILAYHEEVTADLREERAEMQGDYAEVWAERNGLRIVCDQQKTQLAYQSRQIAELTKERNEIFQKYEVAIDSANIWIDARNEALTDLTAARQRIEVLEVYMQAAFEEGYDAGYDNGTDDTSSFESGSGSKHGSIRARDLKDAWRDSSARAALASEPTPEQGGAESGSEHCPECGSIEIPANTPRTVYACGSSGYDQRPGSFLRGAKCATQEAMPAAATPGEEAQP